MPSLKAIRRRIASVKSTQKITKAMKLVAAARLRRATQSILSLRPYAKKTSEVLASVASRASDSTEEGVPPLLQARPEGKNVLVLVFSGDRGLAGTFNANVQRGTDRRIRQLRDAGYNVTLATMGRKGRDYFRRRGYEI